MTITQRDKMFMLFFPSILIAIGYVWFIFGKMREYSNLQQTLVEARARTADQVLLQAQEQELTNATQAIARHQEGITAAQQSWRAAVGSCPDPLPRNERVVRLTDLLKRHHLGLMEDGEIGQMQDKDFIKLPTALEPLAKQITQLAGNAPQLRRVRLQGRYVDMQRALQELGQGELLTIPLALAMKEAIEGMELREWTLLLWI